MKNYIYIASTLSNADRVRKIRDNLYDYGIGLTYDWTEHNDGQPHIPDSEPDLKRSVAEKELIGVRTAEAVLVVLPGGRGTHLELGLAIAWSKPIVMLADKMVGDCPSFYFLDSIRKVASEQEAIQLIISSLRDSSSRDSSSRDSSSRGINCQSIENIESTNGQIVCASGQIMQEKPQC